MRTPPFLLFLSTLLTSQFLASLTNDLPKPFIHTTEYSSGNLSEVQNLWDAISFDEGQISIPHDVAAELQLPPSQPFPWDSTRGIYLINAYHNIHCLVSVSLEVGNPQHSNLRLVAINSKDSYAIPPQASHHLLNTSQYALSRCFTRRHHMPRRRHSALYDQHF